MINDEKKEYHTEFYNEFNEQEQWIRLTDGCFRNCWNCYCPQETKTYDLPKIVRNKVRFLDMNFLYAHPKPLDIINELGSKKVDGKIVHYTFLCGLDFTLMNKEIIYAMKKARIGRFNNKGNYINALSIAWDRGIDEKNKIEECIQNMHEAGYKVSSTQVRMLCNGRVGFLECKEKLKVLKENNVQIDDCWYDNQRRGKVKPIYWTAEECKRFGILCRAHNIAVLQRMYKSLDEIYDK